MVKGKSMFAVRTRVRIDVFKIKKRLFLYKALLLAIVFFSFLENTSFAEGAHNSSNAINPNSANTEPMAVVLTPDDIKPAGDDIVSNDNEVHPDEAINTRDAQPENYPYMSSNDSKEDKELDRKEGKDNEGARGKSASNSAPQPSIPVLTNTDSVEALPQVMHQTVHIGTPQQPTIDGGLISAPELGNVLSQHAENISSASELLALQAVLFKVYVLWEGLKYYDFKVNDLEAVLSRVKTTREIYTHKIWMNFAQTISYWTKLNRSHKLGPAVRARKNPRLSSKNRLTPENRLATLHGSRGGDGVI
jgi:hypothetical protein